MKALLRQPKTRNKTIATAFIFIYCSACIALIELYKFALSDLLITVFCFGLLLSSIAFWLVKNNTAPNEKEFHRSEGWLLPLLLLWIISYITFGSSLINQVLPASWQNNEQNLFLFIIAKKLFVFFLIPFACYRAIGFHGIDFGLKFSWKQFFNKTNWKVFFLFSLVALLLEYFFSNGATAVRGNKFSIIQLAKAILLSFLWLFVEVGLVEEFFYRAIIQSRLTSFFKSAWAGILISGLIFALSHLPGLYLRGGESEGMDHPLSFWFWTCYCIANMSVAGIALGIIWWKTKNLYLVMALHAVIDLLPNLSSFISTWHL